jgi:hypothetical protein
MDTEVDRLVADNCTVCKEDEDPLRLDNRGRFDTD